MVAEAVEVIVHLVVAAEVVVIMSVVELTSEAVWEDMDDMAKIVDALALAEVEVVEDLVEVLEDLVVLLTGHRVCRSVSLFSPMPPISLFHIISLIAPAFSHLLFSHLLSPSHVFCSVA